MVWHLTKRFRVLLASFLIMLPCSLHAQDGFQRIEVAEGQGLTGYADLDFFYEPDDAVRVVIKSMSLRYSAGAGFNNIDGSYKGMDVGGFYSVLTSDMNKPSEYAELSEIDGYLDDSGFFECENCTSFVLPGEMLRKTEWFLPNFVVGDIIFFGNLQMPTRLFEH